ncbi:hypothetical protein PR202_gb16453 [Eleusine coracana subsp. coracana]|uniref:Uncharacterized protein n=1 Tax=Eleusine coracana subsp. coracana TaxID=191504 RepID=A0AAV5F0W9_ELECO|nr:hypothetical protein PR202_gb16453 [Eleusine coracana subsp. coracana]
MSSALSTPFLETLDLMDELDPLAKNWRSLVREMAYAIEDCIDDFVHHLGGIGPEQGFIKKAAHRLKTLRDRHRIANQIDELKARVLEASERRTRYKLGKRVSSSNLVAVDPRVLALYTESTNLVGVDGPREELVKWLIGTQQQPKVVSIIGFGLGKTTLAKEVYNNIGEQFKCKAFISVSQTPDMTRLLSGIQSKLGICGTSSTCEVQDIIDSIREYLKHHRCEEDNFITVVSNSKDMARQHGNKVHRLSLHFSIDDARIILGTTATCLSKARSLAMFGKSECVPPLLLFKYLRVLIIDTSFSGTDKKVDLTEITQLFQLKYLMVKGYNGAVLPRKIRGLTHLETLNIDGKVECIPSDIIHLPHLSHLIVNSDTMLPDGIASIKSLETIRSIKFLSRTVKALGELANLKELMVVRGYYYESVNSIAEGIDTLVSSLGKLRDLRRLRLQDGHLIDDVDDKLGSLWDPPLGIESIQLERWRFPKVPKWIGGHLRNLWHLVLIVRETSTDEVCVLGELPSLTWLVLEVERDPRDKTAIEFGSTAGFPSLVQFFFRCCMDTPAYMRFQTWCMPRLRWLGLHFVQWEWGGATPAGMEHLSSLQHVNVWMDCDSAGDNSPSAVKEAIEHVFKNAAVVNPNRPSVTIYPIVKTRR